MSDQMSQPESAGQADPSDRDVSTTAWVVAIVAAVAIVLFIAWARRDPGFDERVTDPPGAAASASADGGPAG